MKKKDLLLSVATGTKVRDTIAKSPEEEIIGAIFRKLASRPQGVSDAEMQEAIDKYREEHKL
jgi:hypothetical protein